MINQRKDILGEMGVYELNEKRSFSIAIVEIFFKNWGSGDSFIYFLLFR